MISSSGKGLTRLLEGTYLTLGNYDQCLSVVSSVASNETNHSQFDQFNGKYCLLDIAPQSALSVSGSIHSLKESEFFDLTLNVSQKIDVLFRFSEVNSKVGFCLPSTCSDNDVSVLINTGKSVKWVWWQLITNDSGQIYCFREVRFAPESG